MASPDPHIQPIERHAVFVHACFCQSTAELAEVRLGIYTWHLLINAFGALIDQQMSYNDFPNDNFVFRIYLF